MRDPDFKSVLEEATAQLLWEFSRELARLASKAARVLDDAMAPEQEINIRLRAADIVASKLPALLALLDQEQRILRLEDLANGTQ